MPALQINIEMYREAELLLVGTASASSQGWKGWKEPQKPWGPGSAVEGRKAGLREVSFSMGSKTSEPGARNSKRRHHIASEKKKKKKRMS